MILADLNKGSFLFEAPVYDPLDSVKDRKLSGSHPWFRTEAVWKESYDASKLKVLPRRVAFVFEGRDGVKHHWRFLLRTNSAVYPDNMYESE